MDNVKEWKGGRVEGGRVKKWKDGRVEEGKKGRLEEWEKGRMGKCAIGQSNRMSIVGEGIGPWSNLLCLIELQAFAV